ncbi:MAG: hypothetical protein U0W94_01675 [Buchnera aphidicola (Schlechtendalia peitan)]
MCLYSILFPGQELQNLNILRTFIKKNIIIEDTFNESSEYIGFNLNKLIINSSQNDINNSKYTKLITVTSSIAMYRLWKKKTIQFL